MKIYEAETIAVTNCKCAKENNKTVYFQPTLVTEINNIADEISSRFSFNIDNIHNK